MYVTELTSEQETWGGERLASGGPRLALRGSGVVTVPEVHDRDLRPLKGRESVRLVSPLEV